MSTDVLRVQTNQRVDLQDFEFATDKAVQRNAQQPFSQFLANPNGVRSWIVDNFTISNPAAQQIQVDLGVAILADRDGGLVSFGNLVSTGDAQKIVDVNSFADGGYNIYVRFELVEGDSASRIFWNPAGTGQEFSQAINTRRKANWSVRIETSSPGAEWLNIGDLTKDLAAITVLDDKRKLYFEGEIDIDVLTVTDNSVYPSGWSTDGGGAASDRDADRNTNGVKDLQTFTAATRQCLEDLKGRGLRRWWDRDIGGMNIGFDADPVEKTLAVGDADFLIEHPSPSGASFPLILFDTAGGDSFFGFNRATQEHTWRVGGTDEVFINSSGLVVAVGGLNVGFNATPAADQIRVGDANFGLKSISAADIRLEFDSNDYLTYDRNNDIFKFFAGAGNEVLRISESGGNTSQLGFQGTSALLTVNTSSFSFGEKLILPNTATGGTANSLQAGNLIQAAAYVTGAGATPGNAYNITSVSNPSVGTYVIIFSVAPGGSAPENVIMATKQSGGPDDRIMSAESTALGCNVYIRDASAVADIDGPFYVISVGI